MTDHHRGHRRRFSNSEQDDVDETEYGIRRTRRNTAWVYRDSSSLTPAQIMEQEVYYQSAEDALYVCIQIIQMISQISLGLQAIRNIIQSFQYFHLTTSTYFLHYCREFSAKLKQAIHHLMFLLSWVRSYGEIAILYAEDLTVFIRRRNRFSPHQYRHIDQIDRRLCYNWFGHSPHDMRRLYVHWRVPIVFRTSSRHTFQGEEAFIIFLHHLMKGNPFTEMARHTFGGDPRHLSKMFDSMNNHLYNLFYNKISGTSLCQWIPSQIHMCRQLIYDALSDGAIEESIYENGNLINREWILHHFDFSSFRPFGFLDDFCIPTSRPGDSANRTEQYEQDIQRAFYSGYLRAHGLKAQIVYLPIGVIGSVFITEIRQNDNGVQNMSGLNNYLLQLLHGVFVGNMFPALYCDGIFSVLTTILPQFRNPSPDLNFLNMRLASLRESIEHLLADHRTRFRLFAAPHDLHLFGHGVKIRKLCLVSFFTLNCFYCLGGTRCRYFGHIPPTLEEYIPLDEELLPPPAVVLGQIWDYN